MGLWPDAWSKRASIWTYAQLPQGDCAAVANEHYITGTLRSVLPGRVRAGLKRYFGVVHAAASVGHLEGGTAEFQRVIVPSTLRDVDEATVSNAMQLSAPIFGPVPYRGGAVEIEIGLFSIKSEDLTAPFLDILLGVTNVATTAFIPVAQPLTSVLIEGVKALTGSNGGVASLEMGLSRSLNHPMAGDHILVKAASGEVDVAGWTIGRDDLVHVADGGIPSRYPWLAFSIEVSTKRSDWYAIPTLRDAYGQVREAVTRGRQDEARWLLDALRLRAIGSPDLLPRDALSFHEEVSALLARAFPGGPVSGHRVDIGPIEDLDLYRSHT